MVDRKERERLSSESEGAASRPDAKWRADYSKAQHQRRLAGAAADPQMARTRAPRKALTAEEKAAMTASAANWLRLGQRVRITGSSPSIDGSNERRVGRVGVIWRLCSAPFADYVYVNLDLIGRERSEKVVFLELRDVVPIETGDGRGGPGCMPVP